MKREREGEKGESSSSTAAKGKMWALEAADAGGMDELLEVLGYKVKSSDMADVAQKLEQLEMVMSGDGICQLGSDTVHYNPSDLSGWYESMLSELNVDNFAPVTNQSTIYDDYDLTVIPGGAICNKNELGGTENKIMKTEGVSPSTSVSEPRPMVLVDAQEAGVRLVHTLMACAEAIQQENWERADGLVKHIGILAVSQSGAMRKVATYFAEALARRIYKIYPKDTLEVSYSDILEAHFYETCPYLKFAHFTANQAILEAFSGLPRVHVIDFGLKQGMQWPALMQALALRTGGPPEFRLTGIGPPQPDNTDALQQVGLKLAQLAETIGVKFRFRGFVAESLADIEPGMLDIGPSGVESVAINSVFELHRLFSRPGAAEKVLGSIRAIKPKIVTLVEQEANHNGPVFVDRFNEALHYYSTMFDSLESSGLTQCTSEQDVLMSEVYLGRQICNLVACEGVDRVERHETLVQWRARMGLAGFDPVHLGSNAFKQASMLLALFSSGDGYRVEENDGCLMLGWHTRPLIATSAWKLTESE